MALECGLDCRLVGSVDNPGGTGCVVHSSCETQLAAFAGLAAELPDDPVEDDDPDLSLPPPEVAADPESDLLDDESLPDAAAGLASPELSPDLAGAVAEDFVSRLSLR